MVFLTGMGVPARSWFTAEDDPILQDMLTGSVFPAAEFAGVTTVLAYNRAGMGHSSPPGSARTLEDAVRELDSVLDAYGGGPVMLVGHSIGGLIAFEYARRFPLRITGLVLIEASHPHQLERQGAVRSPEQRELYSVVQQRIRDDSPERLDFQRMFSSGDSAAGTLADLPLLVISRGVAPTPEDYQLGDLPPSQAETDRLFGVWQELQADLARASSRSTQVTAQQSAHYPHFDEPELVLHALQQFWTQCRG